MTDKKSRMSSNIGQIGLTIKELIALERQRPLCLQLISVVFIGSFTETKAYEQTFEKEKSVINNHIFHNATRFAVSVNEDQERLPTFYWLPKLHKKPYKARLIANSSSCTTTELSKLLTSCLTTIKKHVIKYCEKSMKGPVKICFGQSKNHVRY